MARPMSRLRPEAGAPTARRAAPRARPRPSPLQWALGVSLAIHLLVLGIHFGLPAMRSAASDLPPLSVVLVNSSTAHQPRHAQALAQADLEGGGSAHSGLAATPLPAAARNQAGDAARDSRRQLSAPSADARRVLSAERSQVVTLQQAAPTRPPTRPGQQPLQAQRREMLQLIGAIERRIALHNANPRRRLVGPDTRSVPYALYYDRMRERIERLGTADFPQSNGHKLYGRLIMAITVDSAGRVLRAEVEHGSGDALLDRMAQAIVRGAQPFGAFTPRMLRDTDQMIVVAGFDFTREGGLHARLRADDLVSPGSRRPR